MRRLDTVEDQSGETKGVLIEWKEVRVADNCAQTLLKIQTMTDAMRRLVGGKIDFHHTCHNLGRTENLDLLNETRYGRLLVSAEIYRCAKRACITFRRHASKQSRGNADTGTRKEENNGNTR